MLSTEQIAEFLYLKNELTYETDFFFVWEEQINYAWSKIATHAQIFSKLNQECIQKTYGQASFV